MKYWVPLLHIVGEQVKFSGQALPLPLDKRIVGNLVKERIPDGFLNPKIQNQEFGLFCKIGHQRYLLGVNKIFSTPDLLAAQDTAQKITPALNRLEKAENISVKKLSLKEEWNNLILSGQHLGEEKNFHQFKDNLDLKMHQKTQMKHQGVKIKLSGRINGVNMAKSVETRWGQIKPQSYNQLEYKLKHVRTPWGIFGLRVYLS